jgi:hypothetical protein
LLGAAIEWQIGSPAYFPYPQFWGEIEHRHDLGAPKKARAGCR